MKLSEFKELKKGDYIEFRGKRYYIFEDLKNERDTPLCTESQFINFEISDAHIYWGNNWNKIMQYGNKIGTVEDINKAKGGK